MQQKTKKWLSLVLAVLLVSACFTGTLLVRAAQDVAIDETHFPDAGFRQIVAEKCDKNGDGILSDTECSSITRMMLPAWQEDVLTDYTRTLCEEAGAESLGWCVGLAGRCLVLAAAWPLMEEILQTIGSIAR